MCKEEIFNEKKEQNFDEIQKLLTELSEKYKVNKKPLLENVFSETSSNDNSFNYSIQEKNIENSNKKEPEEQLPEQGGLFNKIVDVESLDKKRLGTGICLRDDFGYPWKNQVRMITPSFQKGKIINNIRMKLCPSQQIEEN